MPELVFRRNSFQETLIRLEYTSAPDRPVDLFSRACVEHYRELRTDRYGYSFTQVFEPGVLREAALLDGRRYEPLADLSDQPGPAVVRLAELVDNASDLSVIGLVNVASALITISRFDPASRLLRLAEARAVTPRDRLETAMLDFMVANRCDDGVSSPAAFSRMREAIEAGTVPRERVIDVCAQAVVWYLKRKELSEADFRWYVRTGCALTKDPGHIDPTTISAWNRALAMIPAGKGQAVSTRRYMERTREAAQEAITRRSRPYELNFLKTYYESTLKEHLYVTRDFDKARDAGESLIALDSAWSPSYAELAEVHQRAGDKRRAAELYEEAAAMGPPYVGHHLLRATRCWEELGEYERAVDQYLTLCRLAPGNEPLLRSGFRAAQNASSPARDRFERMLAQTAGLTGTGERRP
ncbi:hypothetical protein RKE30_21145 [Streptomyces sp. Li-HN-5-11]|uniref:tetratricopeptide repeat protein n=1 Tax=Streptomyces sp. Li-HN-5-11 TaxID=3075432 RepID=UPI0028A6DD6C|nr:hypothetical protein [Streptomyces sp. Li-HN-5-11]WNM32732.1 hypothetical protein RKE30_21145 [Streptomyces sp. Li-HN-5-11]